MNDLRSVSAKYHRPCYVNICKNDDAPDKTIDPRIMNTNKAMKKIIDYIDHPHCQFSLSELMNVVSDNLPSHVTIKRRLEDYYGEDLVVSSYQGLSTLFIKKKNIRTF